MTDPVWPWPDFLRRDYRPHIFSFFLHESYAAGGRHDARLSGAGRHLAHRNSERIDTHNPAPGSALFRAPASYHYGMDVAVAMFAHPTRLNTRDLALALFHLVSRAFDAQCFLLFEELASVRSTSGLSSCSSCFLAKTSPSFPDCYWVKTLTGPFAASVCRPPFCPSSIRIQSFLDWVSFLRG